MKFVIIYHSESWNTQKMADLVRDGCLKIKGVEARCMSIGNIDEAFVVESVAVIFGSPTYEGTCSWQMKKYLDTEPNGLSGKLGGVFVSQNWPGD